MRGRSTSTRKAAPVPKILGAAIGGPRTSQLLMVALHDGRVIGLPLSLFPILVAAKKSDRDEMEVVGDGAGLRWHRLDVDLSVEGLIAGRPDFTARAGTIASERNLAAYFRSLAGFAVRRAG